MPRQSRLTARQGACVAALRPDRADARAFVRVRRSVVCTRELFWQPRGFWKQFDPDSTSNVQRRVRQSQRSQSVGRSSSVTGFTINESWTSKFVLASSGFVGQENRQLGLVGTGWAPLDQAPVMFADGAGARR